MRDLEINDKVVFVQETESTTKTEKIPVQLIALDLTTGKGVMQCVCFKDSKSKTAYKKALDTYATERDSISADINAFNKKHLASIDKIQGGDEKLRAELKAEMDALNKRKVENVAPELDRTCAMLGNFEVQLNDLSFVADLVKTIAV